jgi:DNA (cytosine-5)-methyltransferase 1
LRQQQPLGTPLGWTPQWFSEIEKFPSAVLKHHYPAVPNHGDMTKFKEWNDGRPIDVLVGGTPCQSFSVAGLRKGLDDPRGNLMLTYLAIAERYAPKWIVWENVPGVLSSNRGRDFGTFLGALGQLGYGFAYRVLDAQYFGVAQRRKRVFVVGYLGDWRRAAAVLFERESLRGYPAPSRKTREEIAGTIKESTYSGGAGGKPEGAAVNHFITARMRGFGDYSSDGTARTVKARNYKDATDLVSVGYTSSSFANYKEGIGTVRASGGDLGGGSETIIAFPAEMSGTQSATTVNLSPALSVKHTIALSSKQQSMKTSDNVANTLGANDYKEPQAVAYDSTVTAPLNTQLGLRGPDVSNSLREGVGIGNVGDPAFTLQASHGHGVITPSQVRRLTPIECERLQGFPDGYTDIRLNDKQTPDGPRYKAMGNSMAVPVMNWIGRRIQMVEDTE